MTLKITEHNVITIQQAINEGRTELTNHATETIIHPQNEALLLLQHACDKSKEFLIAHSDETLNTNTHQLFQAYIARRITGEPIAYITQEKEFWSLSLKVEPGILIPRPETELLVEAALAATNKTDINILELGTGSGCIALALAKQLPKASIIATDISQQCLDLAQHNALNHDCPHIQFINSHWFENIAQHDFDLIISNPPYISTDDKNIAQTVHDFEPHTALFSNNDGLADLHHIIQYAPEYLIAGGTLLLEHGFQQAQAVYAQFEKFGYNNIHTTQDMQQHERVTQGKFIH